MSEARDSLTVAGRKVLVVGLGRSGLAAARLLAARGAHVTVTDRRPAAALAGALATLPPGVEHILGEHRRDDFVGADLIVVSPGVPPIEELVAARVAGVTIIGEIELAFRNTAAPVVAITGTNGKSTTTALVGTMLAAGGRPTFVGGNLGTPYLEVVGTPAAGAGGLCVVEVSSFQLETVDQFRPRVAVLLNIREDHLDRYPDMAAYASAKANVFAAQTPTDFAIVNADDVRAVSLARAGQATVVAFSTGPDPDRDVLAGCVAEDGALLVRLPGALVDERYPFPTPGLSGRHNQENALAAVLAARLAGATAAECAGALAHFQPLPHRIELVGEGGGVGFYDDSKGTNVDAVVAAIESLAFPGGGAAPVRRVVLIAGGRDKGGDYAPLVAMLGRVARGVVLIGEGAARLREAISSALGDAVSIADATSMEDAVTRARAMAQAGDAVVLSPACSSFDMFRDYEHRAQAFRGAVEAALS